MAKRISASELFEKEDIFAGIRKSAEDTMVTLNQVDDEFKKIGATLKGDISKAKIGGAKELKEFMELVEKANNLQTNTIKLEKEKAIAEQQSEKLKQQKIRTQTAENRQQERINKQKAKATKLAKDETSAYKKLVVATRDLKNQSKDLGAQMLMLEQSGKKNTTQYRKLSEQYKRVSKSAQNGDAQLKKLDKTVGDNFRNVGNYTGALNTLKTGLAQLGLAFGIGQVVRGGMEAIMDFDQAIADLSAITGASGKDLQFYKKQANELGIEVEGGASAVVEAYKLIGSAKPELLENAEALNEVTKSAILLSQASGLDLPEASKRLTSALNQFQAPAEESARFINVLANASKFGSAEIPDVTDALLKFGGVAQSFNVSIEESASAIELLRPSFASATEVGTALKNIMLKMSAPEGTPALAKAFREAGIDVETMSDKTLSFEDRVRTLLPLLEDENAMVKVFKSENIIGAKALLTQVDAMDEMTTKMSTLGTVQEQANKRTNTLSHSLMELKNQFFGLFTQIGSGEGSMQWFIDGIKWLGQNLPLIATVIFKVVRAWAVYKTTMLALKGINFAVSGGFKDIGRQMAKQIPLTRAYRLEQIKLARASRDGADAIKGGTKAVNGFGKAFASIGIFLIITAVTELAMAWYDVASGTKKAREEEEKQAKQKEAITKSQSKEAKNILARDTEIRQRKEKDFDEIEKQLRIDNLATNSKKKQQANEIQALKDKQKIVQKIIDTEKENLPIYNQKVIDAKATDQRNKKQGVDRTKSIIKLNQMNKIQHSLNNNIAVYQDIYDDLSLTEKETNKEKKKSGTHTITSTKVINTQYKETNAYLSKQLELTQKISEIEQKRELIKREKGIEKEFEAQLKLLEETGEFDATRLNDLIQNKITLEQEYIDQRTIYELGALEKKYESIEKKEFDALEKQRKTLVAGAKGNAEAIEQINKNFDLKKKELEAKETIRQNDRAKEEVIIVENAENEKLEIREDGFDSIDDYNAEFLDKEKDLTEKLKDEEQQRAEDTQAFVKATADYFIKQSNKKIEQIDKEISEAEKQSETLRALAENGNIEAKESLAEQQKIIADANRKKEQEQKRQQRIQLASSVYSTYSSKVASGSKNPLAETIRDTTLLQQFIQSLPTFEDGVDDTGTNGRGIDGKGGFLSVLHPNERVVPKSLNEQIGGLTNDELSNLAMEYQNGKIIRSDSQTSSALELSILVNRLDNLTKVIQDKPETNIELGEITQGAMEIVKSTKKGNTIVYNRYKVK